MNAEIKDTLMAHLSRINDSDTSQLLKAMEEIDRLRVESTKEIPPQLLHFLERRSYAKALAYLSESGPEPVK